MLSRLDLYSKIKSYKQFQGMIYPVSHRKHARQHGQIAIRVQRCVAGNVHREIELYKRQKLRAFESATQNLNTLNI